MRSQSRAESSAVRRPVTPATRRPARDASSPTRSPRAPAIRTRLRPARRAPEAYPLRRPAEPGCRPVDIGAEPNVLHPDPVGHVASMGTDQLERSVRVIGEVGTQEGAGEDDPHQPARVADRVEPGVGEVARGGAQRGRRRMRSDDRPQLQAREVPLGRPRNYADTAVRRPVQSFGAGLLSMLSAFAPPSRAGIAASCDRWCCCLPCYWRDEVSERPTRALLSFLTGIRSASATDVLPGSRPSRRLIRDCRFRDRGAAAPRASIEGFAAVPDQE
jgi:hypothetical protein